MPAGRITSVQVSPDGRRWFEPPPAPEIARFASFLVYVYAAVTVEDVARFRCAMAFTGPEGEEVEVEPVEGTLGSGSYYFPFPLRTGAEASLGVWRARTALHYRDQAGEWRQLDSWEGELLELIAVGDPSGEVVGVSFTTDFSTWLTTPMMVEPGSPFGFQVVFNVWLPLRTEVGVELSLLDPYGEVFQTDFPTGEFPPGASQGTGTFRVESMPETQGDWIGRAVVRARHEGEWRDLAVWDGYACRIGAAEEAPGLLGVVAPVAGVALLGMVMAPMVRTARKGAG